MRRKTTDLHVDHAGNGQIVIKGVLGDVAWINPNLPETYQESIARTFALSPDAVNAVAEYAVLTDQIRQLTGTIRCTSCPDENVEDGTSSCLTDFFGNVAEYRNQNWRTDTQHAGEIVLEEMLAEDLMCDVCRAKLEAIEARKPLRIKLGAIKRKIARLGKAVQA